MSTSNLTCSKLSSSCPRCPKPLPSVVFLISVLVTAVFQLLKMEFRSLSLPHNPLCIHWTISVAIPQNHVRNLCLPLLLPPLSPSLSSFLGYFISFSLPLCSLFTAQQPNPTTYLLKTLWFKFPSSEALYSFLGLFLLLLLFSSFSLLEPHWPLYFPWTQASFLLFAVALVCLERSSLDPSTWLEVFTQKWRDKSKSSLASLYKMSYSPLCYCSFSSLSLSLTHYMFYLCLLFIINIYLYFTMSVSLPC